LWEEAFAVQVRELGPSNPETAESLAMLVGILNRTGRAAEAEPRIRESVRIIRSVFGARHPQTAFVEATLGENLVAQGRFSEAEPILLESHEVVLASGCATDFVPLDSLKRMVALYDAWGKLDEASHYRAELARRCAGAKTMMPYPLLRLLYGEDAKVVRDGLDRMQGLAGTMGQNTAAPTNASHAPIDIGEMLEAMLSTSARLWDATDPMTLLLGRKLALSSGELEGQVLDANRERMNAAALGMLEPWREQIPPIELADALASRARFVRSSGDRQRAEQLAREAWELVRRRDEGERPAKEAWTVAYAKLRIARALAMSGLAAEAEQLLLPSHATLLAQLGPKHRITRAAAAALQELYTELERPAEAAKFAGAEGR
jgi:hypothetical protein